MAESFLLIVSFSMMVISRFKTLVINRDGEFFHHFSVVAVAVAVGSVAERRSKAELFLPVMWTHSVAARGAGVAAVAAELHSVLPRSQSTREQAAQ